MKRLVEQKYFNLECEVIEGITYSVEHDIGVQIFVLKSVSTMCCTVLNNLCKSQFLQWNTEVIRTYLMSYWEDSSKNFVKVLENDLAFVIILILLLYFSFIV